MRLISLDLRSLAASSDKIPLLKMKNHQIMELCHITPKIFINILQQITNMKKEQILSLIGIAAFLIVTSLTYGIVTPFNETTTNNSLITITNDITNTTQNNTTNTTHDAGRLTNNYRIMIAITAGIVIAILAIFYLTSW